MAASSKAVGYADTAGSLGAERRSVRHGQPSLRLTSRVLLIGVAVLVAWVLISLLLARGTVMPGVHVGSVPVGGMSRTDASLTIQQQTAAFMDAPVSLTIDGATVTAQPEDLGLAVDHEHAVDAALAYGRDDGVVERLMRTVRFTPDAVHLPLTMRFDTERFNAYLDTLDAELGRAPVNAAVTIESGAAIVSPSQEGIAIDRLALQSLIAEQTTALQPMTVAIPLVTHQPAIATEAAESMRTLVDRALDTPLVLTAGDASWALTSAEMASLIAVEEDTMQPGLLRVRMDGEAVRDIVDRIAAEVAREPQRAWVQDLGTHSWLVPGQEGRVVDRNALIERMEAAVASGDSTVAVPVKTSQPDITTTALMAELGITDEVGVGDSIYAGSGSGRAHNVELAAYKLDGTLVPPGGVFSFNDTVGSLFNGDWREAGSYIDGPNGQSLAGGVCQVSTTVYRAALAGGLPIVEWWPHSYRSPFYELGGWSPGFDASIVQDGNNPELSADFRFRNPTDAWMMIRSNVTDAGELRVEILGAPTGYRVWMSEPTIEVIERATDTVAIAVDDDLPPGTVLPDQPAMHGLWVSVTRTVHDSAGALVRSDTWVSTYGSYGAIRRASPDMAG